MPKLASCHYNKEEISGHSEKNIGYWPVQMNGNKFATGHILRKPVDVVKGRILAGWAQKSPEPCLRGIGNKHIGGLVFMWDIRWEVCLYTIIPSLQSN